MSPFRCALATLTVLAVLVGPGPVRRGFADDDFSPLSLVSESAAICLEVPHFEATWSKFGKSRLGTRLKTVPQVERFLNGSGFQQWMLVEEYVRRSTGKSLSDQLIGTLSESLVVAVYLPDGKPPEGVVIAQARDADALSQALQAWDKLEPQRISQIREYRGQKYVRRAKSTNSTEIVFHTTFGRMIALSNHELLIQQVIDFHHSAIQKSSEAGAGAPRRLQDLALYQANRARLPRESAALLFFNSRKWDAVLADGVRQAPDAQWLQPIFRHIAGLAVSLRLDDEVVVDLVMDTSGPELPATWGQFVAGTRGGSRLSDRVSDDSILAASSRMEITPLIQAWMASTPDARTSDFARGRNVLKSVLLGRDFFTDVLPLVMRDWSVCLIPASDSASDTPPLDLVGRFTLVDRPAAVDPRPSLHESIDRALQSGMTLVAAMLSHQRGDSSAEPVLVKTESTPTGIARSLDGLNIWSPGYAVTPQELTVASRRQSLPQKHEHTAESPGGRRSRLAACEHRYFSSATQLVWLDTVRLRDLLARRADWIARQFAPTSTDDRQRVEKHLSRIEEVSKVFDAAFLAAKLDEDHVHFVVGVSLDRSE